MKDDYEDISMGDARPIRSSSIDDLKLSYRTYKYLERAGLNLVDEICQLTSDELLKIVCSRKRYEEVIERLSEFGRTLKPNQNNNDYDENEPTKENDEIQATLEKILIDKGLQILKDGERAASIFRSEMQSSRSRNIIAMIFDCGEGEKLSTEDANADMLRSEICERLSDEYGVSRNISEPIVEKLQKAIESAKNARKNMFGRSICNSLKEMRRQFADANGIEYQEEDCTNTNSCTGTCPYCEEKNRYLLDQARKLSEEKEIVYPEFSLPSYEESENKIDNTEFQPPIHGQRGAVVYSHF